MLFSAIPSGGGSTTSPGGSLNAIQYNNGGSFGGITPGTGVATALSQAVTGTGGFVLSTSPALITPNLGVPSALTLTNATGLPLAGLTGLGTGVSTALGQAVTGTGGLVLAASPALTTPNLGTPSALTLTNATGLPVAGLTGLGTGVATSLGSAVTGSGGIVLGTSPTLTTPSLGTPSALTLTNATGLPIAGLTGLGTGVATSLGSAVTGTGGLVLGIAPTITAPLTLTGVAGSSALTINGATQTTSQPLLNGSQTWSASGVTFTGFKVSIIDTASAAGSMLFDFQINGVTKVNGTKGGALTASGYFVSGNAGLNYNTGYATTLNGYQIGASLDAPDVFLRRDAANTLAQRNGTSAQRMRVYNSFTDASNGEWFSVDWQTTANTVIVGPKANGTGTARPMSLASLDSTTGAGTPTFSNNSPAVTPGTIYTWLKMTSSDGSTVYVPAWK